MTQIYVFLVITISIFTMKKLLAKQMKKKPFYQKCEHLSENTFLYYSRIIAVQVHVKKSQNSPTCYNIANAIKPRSDTKTTDKHAASATTPINILNSKKNVITYLNYLSTKTAQKSNLKSHRYRYY